MYSGLHSLPIDAKFRASLDGTNLPGDGCLVLTSDPKPRLRWTAELHERFIDAVTQLGGPEKATPKTIMRTMGVKGLTLYHLKSHLQKYRLGKQSCKELAENMKDASNISQNPDSTSSPLASSGMIPTDVNDGFQVTEALRVQMEVQRRLHEQLGVQRRLQLRIEAQGKYLQSILEKACQALNDQTLTPARIEAAREELSELEIKVSTNYRAIGGSRDTFKMPPSVSEFSAAVPRVGDCSVESCLTSAGSPVSPVRKGLDGTEMERRSRSLFGNGDSTLMVDPNMDQEMEWMMRNIG